MSNFPPLFCFLSHVCEKNNFQVEKERGITVKAMTASIFYEDPKTNEKYLLNLIDTPGHADFGYEVFFVLSVIVISHLGFLTFFFISFFLSCLLSGFTINGCM